MKHITITDIAKKLGISPSTVSRALSNHPDIKDETKKLVKKIAEESNYIPNPIAQSLKSRHTSVIGVIVPEIKHDFFSSAISGIEEIAYHAGYTIIVSQSNESYEREIINTNSLVQQRVEGLIVSISQVTSDSSHFRAVTDRGIPLVFFDRTCDDIVANKVVIDDVKSALNAVNHLISRGYIKIAHFAGPKELDICKKRMEGYRNALLNAGYIIDEDLIRFGGLHETDGYSSMEYLISMNKLPDAIFCANDPIAIGAYQKIKEVGLRIPDDIGLMGFSNNKITSLVDPPITTVDQPSFEMGKKSAEILIDMIENRKQNSEASTFILDAKLIIRGST